jgi:glucose-1-phosphatase
MFNLQIAGKLGMKETELAGIKNIIFDLGGVIIQIHYTKTIELFKQYGFDNFEAIYTLMKQSHLFDKLETGKIHPHAFRKELQKYQGNLTNETIDLAWNAMIGEMPEENIRILQQIRKKYRTFLLSNTNEIHIDYFYNYLLERFHYNPLPEMFEHTYYSFEMGYRKPETDAYEFVLNREGLKPHETLFIDDLKVNTDAAKKTGMHSIHLVDTTIQNLFISES